MRTVRSPRLGVRGPASVLLAVVSLVALSGCGADEPGGEPTSVSSTPIESTASETPSDEPTESEEPTETETTEDSADVEIVVTIVGDTVTTESDRVAVAVGQTVRITATCDVAEEVHVHGFDLSLDLEPGEPGELEFEVGTSPGPGLYEVELEEQGLLLFQLEVR